MKRLEPFRYHEPTTLAEAIDCLITGGRNPQVLAGGTSVLLTRRRAGAMSSGA
jgi:CO/xanthine dehydrogenase FAD-binding subunit